MEFKQDQVKGLEAALAAKPELPGSLATGDIFYWNGTALAKVPVGDEGETLQIISGAIAWGEPVASGLLTIDDAVDFGTGADGAVTYSSNTTITSDVLGTTVVINSGVTVSVGWNSSEGRPAVLRATTSITNNGVIACNGINGSGSTAGAGGATSGGSSAGGAGGNGTNPPTAGNGGNGGGGRGGPSFSANGGSYQRAGGLSQPFPLPLDLSDLPLLGGGGGGGSYSISGTPYYGGGSGGGGGVYLLAPTITGTGTIRANGAAAQGSVSFAVGGAGGGGGLLIVCRSLGTSLVFEAQGGKNTHRPTDDAGGDGVICIACEVLPSAPDAKGVVIGIEVKP